MADKNVVRPPPHWSKETGDRLKHFQIAETSRQTGGATIHRYARQDRWRRRLEAWTLAAYTAIAVLMCWLVIAAVSALLVTW
jgi:hypothetical protein